MLTNALAYLSGESAMRGKKLYNVGSRTATNLPICVERSQVKFGFVGSSGGAVVTALDY